VLILKKREKKSGYFSHLSSYELVQRADLCRASGNQYPSCCTLWYVWVDFGYTCLVEFGFRLHLVTWRALSVWLYPLVPVEGDAVLWVVGQNLRFDEAVGAAVKARCVFSAGGGGGHVSQVDEGGGGSGALSHGNRNYDSVGPYRQCNFRLATISFLDPLTSSLYADQGSAVCPGCQGGGCSECSRVHWYTTSK